VAFVPNISKSELELMRESGRIAGIAFQHAMKETKADMNESQIHAILGTSI
jgi:Xaa-Pro aminopeptidase